jgi:albonoursin synthase
MMDTLEAIFTRRSVRAFTDDPVPAELMRQVLQAGVASASGGNVQPWGFVLIQSPARLAGLRSLAPGIIGPPAAVIAICLDAGRATRLGGTADERPAWLDIGLATQNLLLAAHSLGLGACPIGSFHQAAVACYLGLPEQVQPILLLAMGYPRIKPAPPGRRPMAKVCFLEEWNAPYE